MIISKLKKIKFFEDFFTEKSLRQFKKYLVTGFTSFSVEWILFYIFKNVIDIYYIYANIIVYVIAFWMVFLINRFWSFESTGALGKQLFYYIILFTFNLVVGNIYLLYLLSDVVGIMPEISKVMIMGVVVSWNFVIYKKVIYKT